MVKTVARCGPVHFQALEDELAPLAPYFNGAMLNAGCGDRDLRSWLAAEGVTELVNFDIASSIPGAVLGSLEDMPFPEDRFDAVLCNAVLEHVGHVDAVIAELARVLSPRGYAVLAVPFLQPYHQCPTDFRRYTADGLIALGEGAGLKLVSVNPVHSMAQTLGWIAWEIAQEKGRLLSSLTWPLIYLWTRFSLKTDPRITRNANTYQVVFQKP